MLCALSPTQISQTCPSCLISKKHLKEKTLKLATRICLLKVMVANAKGWLGG